VPPLSLSERVGVRDNLPRLTALGYEACTYRPVTGMVGFSLLVQWEPDGEGSAFTFFARHLDLSAVVLDNSVAHG
jgi:hypothetical protein